MKNSSDISTDMSEHACGGGKERWREVKHGKKEKGCAWG